MHSLVQLQPDNHGSINPLYTVHMYIHTDISQLPVVLNMPWYVLYMKIHTKSTPHHQHISTTGTGTNKQDIQAKKNRKFERDCIKRSGDKIGTQTHVMTHDHVVQCVAYQTERMAWICLEFFITSSHDTHHL